MNRRRMSDRYIEDYLASLENGYLSEDDEDVDDNDLAYYPDVADLQRDLEEDEDEVNAGAGPSEDEVNAGAGSSVDEVNAGAGLSEFEDPPLIETESNLNSSTVSPLQRSNPIGREFWRNQSRNLIWKKKNLDFDEDRVRFLGNAEANKDRQKTLMSLADFRSELAHTLCLYKNLETVRRGRPSTQSIDKEIEAKKRRGPMKPVPGKDVRTDGVGHYERRCDKKNRCKNPGCKGFTRTECSKCKVALCHTKERNCFAFFHSIPQ